MDPRPIGVFDSGVGGLTILRVPGPQQQHCVMPEWIIVLADAIGRIHHLIRKMTEVANAAIMTLR